MAEPAVDAHGWAWDWFPVYRLPQTSLQDYLKKKFGDFEFYVMVRGILDDNRHALQVSSEQSFEADDSRACPDTKRQFSHVDSQAPHRCMLFH
jgi:hypothetical protein